uniref:Uncharacterized protein n=1 Tax=Triticum urartu TaxID=4572 RepID=A0A8R7UZV7_TRIUA
MDFIMKRVIFLCCKLHIQRNG